MDAERLLRSAARKDLRALDELIRLLAPAVHGYLSGMVGDATDAGLLTQETFVRLARSLDRSTGDEDPEVWALAAARRIARDADAGRSSDPPGTPPPASLVATSAWARRALAAVPFDLREVLVCRDVLGWDDARVARVLGVPASDIQSTVVTAREALVGPNLGEVAAAAAPSE